MRKAQGMFFINYVREQAQLSALTRIKSPTRPVAMGYCG